MQKQSKNWHGVQYPLTLKVGSNYCVDPCLIAFEVIFTVNKAHNTTIDEVYLWSCKTSIIHGQLPFVRIHGKRAWLLCLRKQISWINQWISSTCVTWCEIFLLYIWPFSQLPTFLQKSSRNFHFVITVQTSSGKTNIYSLTFKYKLYII